MTTVGYGPTTSLCRACQRSVPAEVIRVADAVLLTKVCPTHGPAQVVIAESADWYERTMAQPASLRAPADAAPASQGCPFDCGPCTSHQQTSQLPIVPITSACNLDCPICYTHNRNHDSFHMSENELRSILHHICRTDPERRIINLTGGEPTQHPAFERLIALCKEEGIHRVTISTHGLRFLKEEALLARLAELDARIVLSFDSFRPDTNQAMLGGRFLDGKLAVVDLLERYQVNTTLLPVLARGHNDDEIGAFIQLALERPFIRSLELHTMTFTGQSGKTFDQAARYSPDAVLRDIERQTAGRLRVDDFVPSPAAHPLCYQVTYLLDASVGRGALDRRAPNDWVPFLRFMSPDDLRTILAGALYLEPSAEMEQRLADIINQVWSTEAAPDSSFDRDAVLLALRRMVDDAFAPDRTPVARMQGAERHAKAIYVHSHMDEDTFDTDRIRQCCVGIREPDGRNIPSCAYNVLYRERDARFAVAPPVKLVALGKGRPAVDGQWR